MSQTFLENLPTTDSDCQESFIDLCKQTDLCLDFESNLRVIENLAKEIYLVFKIPKS